MIFAMIQNVCNEQQLLIIPFVSFMRIYSCFLNKRFCVIIINYQLAIVNNDFSFKSKKFSEIYSNHQH